MTEERIQTLGKKYHKSTAQIILKWHIQMGYVVIPGSKSEAHIKENIDLFDFELTLEEMKEISQLDKNSPFYIRTEAALKNYANWCPDVEGQK